MSVNPNRITTAKLSPDAIRTILLEQETPTKDLADRFGVSRQSINDVRLGKRWKDLYPELPRYSTKPARSCWSCANAKVTADKGRHLEIKKDLRCLLDFPDPFEVGARFAAECAAYLPRDAP